MKMIIWSRWWVSRFSTTMVAITPIPQKSSELQLGKLKWGWSFLWANMGWWVGENGSFDGPGNLTITLLTTSTYSWTRGGRQGPLALYRRCLVWCLSTNLTEKRLDALMRSGWSQLLEAADAWLQLSCDVLGAVKWWRNSTKSQILIISQAVHLLWSEDLMLRSTEKILRRISPPSTISPCLSAKKSVPWC